MAQLVGSESGITAHRVGKEEIQALGTFTKGRGFV